MRIAVLGVGNILLRDEGVGVHLIRELRRLPLPEGVEVIDGGTSPEAAYLAAGYEKLIIVDAAPLGLSPPGTVYRLTLEEAIRHLGQGGDLRRLHLLSGHELDLFQCLSALGPEEGPKEVVVLGIEPKELGWGLELSPELRAKLGDLCRAVLRECGFESEDGAGPAPAEVRALLRPDRRGARASRRDRP
ncbi:MAG: hydrogenase maturation protease [Candidatus Acetothermia bacterium]|jgi:hydrogenase maturation protease|nr:hydrogenase maturation protease [Candidatus Acetothermia bacterium]MDH7505406.1 hydrogenase maturation protease [Candidatus Acetothermia bacterium]